LVLARARHRGPVKKRIGDRRRGPRFEIVGTLSGTLETWRRLKLLNLGAGGALMESTTPMLPGTRANGRVVINGQLRDVRAIVRRVAPEGTHRRYQVAVEWGQALAEGDALLAADHVPPRRESTRSMVDRRRAVRVAPPGPSEIQWPTWSTIELIDISTTGVLFASPVALEEGESGQLRMRLGEGSFNADVEVRRGNPTGPKAGTYRVGAQFTSLDEPSRLTLDDFLGGQRE
jgi:hypothetical protein